MEKYFLLIELGSFFLAGYFLFRKRELAIIYLPVLIFASNIIEHRFSASIYYGAVSTLILYGIFRNAGFYKANLFAGLLFCYFLLLLTRSDDLTRIRANAFPVFWFFASIPLIDTVYRKHSFERVSKELTLSAIMVLALFVSNVLLSTLYNYSPTRMYGITGGILFGNVYAAGFNIVAIAIFIVVLKFIATRKLAYLALVIIAYAFIMLSLRRSVMLVSSIGVAVALLTLLFRKEAKKFLVLGSLVVLSGFFIYSKTNFETEFKKRYELRQLDERELGNEARFTEYQLVYKDMFVYNLYSPLIGFGLFDSAGNYGRRIFELRTLHGDIPAMVHSSGIIGLLLYCLMIGTVFRKSFILATSAVDKSVLFFASAALLVYTFTGRFTEGGSMLLMFLLIMLPLARKYTPKDEPGTRES